MRKEKDSMGEVSVPDDSYYGAQTQRAKENFNISGKSIPIPIIKALGYIKKSAAIVHKKNGAKRRVAGSENGIDEGRDRAALRQDDEPTEQQHGPLSETQVEPHAQERRC